MARAASSISSQARALGRLDPERAATFVCDTQERFKSVVHRFGAMAGACNLLAKGSEQVNVPVVATEQVPDKLGNLVEEVSSALPQGTPVFPKKQFSMWVPEVKSNLVKRHPGADQILLSGLEAHVCILQSALDLMADGYEVHVVVDAVSSQRPEERSVALNRLSQSGAFLCTAEMALLQLIRGADSDSFKPINRLLRDAHQAESLGM